jgi:DNA-binding CsgD family transcriptional regulator
VFLEFLRGSSREEMAEKLGLSTRTVRYHLANLQKKTTMPNEKSLADFYESWKLEP